MTTTRRCLDCGSPVARRETPPSYIYPDGQYWTCRGKCNLTGYGCAKPTRRTEEVR